MNHRSFEDISLAQAREELDSIDAILGTSSFFAYPYGRTPLNVDVINYVAQRFKGVFICENNIAQDPSSPSFDGSHIPRIEMNEHGLYKLSLIDWVVSGNEACAEDHMKKQAPSQRLIILDPGHGGKKNKGTQLLEITEDEITYDIVARIMEILEKDGYNSVQTLYDSVTKNIPRDTLHNDDNEGILLPSGKTTAITGYGNMQRAEVMNAWDMKRHEDPIVVSVHVNASSSYLCGAAFYYPDALKYGSLETERASLELVDFLKAEFSQSEVPTYSLCLGDTRIDGVVEDERTKTANETLTIFSNTPDIATKVLIETANAANPNDAVRVLSPQGRQDIAVAVAKGIESYLKEHPMK
jgi:N-acetylmuramoyl-L-alanine amidase